MTDSFRHRILLVDDSPIALELARHALESSGYDVVTARDMAELEDHCARSEVDLILMDVQMPELFGDDVAMVLRAVRGVATPIYLLSSLAPDELAERARASDVDGFISKSDGPAALISQVAQIFGPRVERT